jgi:hypothetical protein
MFARLQGPRVLAGRYNTAYIFIIMSLRNSIFRITAFVLHLLAGHGLICKQLACTIRAERKLWLRESPRDKLIPTSACHFA